MLLIILLTANSILYSQTPSIIWNKNYGDQWINKSSSVIECFDGGYCFVGNTETGNAPIRIDIIRTDVNGETLWTQCYKNPDNVLCTSILQKNNNEFLIAANLDTNNFTKYKIHPIIINANGAVIWTTNVNLNNYTDSYCFSILENDQEQLLWSGRTHNPATGEMNSFLLITDLFARPLHTKFFAHYLEFQFFSIIKPAQSNCYILAGMTQLSPRNTNYDICLSKVDSIGNEIFTKDFGDSLNNIGAKVVQSYDNGFIILGSKQDSTKRDRIYIIKTDSAGLTKWSTAYAVLSTASSNFSIRQTQDCGLIFLSFLTETKSLLVRTNPLGDTVWTMQLSCGIGGHGEALQVTRDGGYIVLGQTINWDNWVYDYSLVKLSPEPPPVRIRVLTTDDGDTTKRINNYTISTDSTLRLWSTGYNAKPQFMGYYNVRWQAHQVSGDFNYSIPDTFWTTLAPTKPGSGYFTVAFYDSTDTLYDTTGLITITAGTPRSLEICKANNTPLVDTSVSTAETLTLATVTRDADQNILPGVPIRWRISGGLDSTALVYTDNDRVKFVSRKLGTGYLTAIGPDSIKDTVGITVFNRPPTITLAPFNTRTGGNVPIVYQLSDNEHDTINLAGRYSLDHGFTWTPATVTGAVKGIRVTGYIGACQWQSWRDLAGQVRDSVLFMAVPQDFCQTGTGDTTTFFRLANPLGDYDRNTKVNFDDLAVFAQSWHARDSTRDMGPVTGTVPSLTLLPDKRIDHEDLYVFLLMWNWSYADSVHYTLYSTLRPALPATACLELYSLAPQVCGLRVVNVPEPLAVSVEITYDPAAISIRSVAKSTALDDQTVFITVHDTTRGQVVVNAALLDGTWMRDGHLDLARFAYTNKSVVRPANVILTCDLRNAQNQRTAYGSTILEWPCTVADTETPTAGPNPFHFSTSISLPENNSSRRVRIFGLYGQLVRDITLSPGAVGFTWDGMDNAGRPVGRGLYFIRVEAGKRTESCRLLMKLE
jgi:hypothetical protein